MNRGRNIKVILAYDGTNYHGFQIQKGKRLPTIQGVLQRELSHLAKETITVTTAGRTDSGVHARGQVFNFFTGNWQIPVDRVIYALNSVLPPDIRALSAEEVDLGFHARYSALAKTYCYYISRDQIVSPFTRLYSYQYNYPLDLDDMRQAVLHITGEHDFKSFMASGSLVKSTIRTIYQIDLIEKDKMLIFTFRGNGFLYHMVRIITGTLLQVGTGKIHYSEIETILKKCDRKSAGATVPALGLFLERVEY
ncbi:tRNA pseudouridine synthase A [Desulfofarcimen acetoxidans DSM 771]|uniref:tRNA pseudouridine synthase A n=1 Tax=Desulfofarcimen acetoxidans (strain ATCC 49208 / DSM 771 / KCTC 5769 / VKM B-1644 / 5575) TaxID=485916 RepID=C8W418_DESAS|nr:tRNA pseudouridine(38-40) synthase TruA [Desulfofarcimen acetoxidans]ACV61272.1 tRNA pseudouridine synthase A [Desulfofarcimen acetoxidans DSM 771]